MRAFFSFLLKSIVFTLAGSFILYVLVFFLLTPRTPKNAVEIVEMIKEIPNVKENFQKMLSRNYEAVSHINLDEDVVVGSPAPTEPSSQKLSEDIVTRLQAVESRDKELSDLKRDLERMQEQLDRLENENRALSLKLDEVVKTKTR